LDALQEKSSDESTRAYADAVVAVHLGQDTDGLKGLETALEAHSEDSGFLYDAACVYSVASKARKDDSAAKSQEYADRAVALLTQAVDNGYSDFSDIRTDPDLEPIWQHPGFVKLLQPPRAAVAAGSHHYASEQN
jgi:hypothetical protein